MRTPVRLVVLVALAMAACSTPATPGPSMEVDCATFDDEGAGGATVKRHLDVGVNQTFDITLCSNPSTGFSWESPTGEGDAVAELVERSVLQTVGGPPGEAGRERFGFRTTAVGNGTIHFVYSQPWEGGTQGAWRFDLDLSVD
jgi:predicted secreted protein